MINQTGLYNTLHDEFDLEKLALESDFNEDIWNFQEENCFCLQSEAISSIGKQSLEITTPQKLSPKIHRRKIVIRLVRKSDENSIPQDLNRRLIIKGRTIHDSSALDEKDLKKTKVCTDNDNKSYVFKKLTPNLKKIDSITIKLIKKYK